MLQRLKLAMADLIPTPILYLDEPLSSLDQEGRDLFNELIIKWKNINRTMLIATHNIDWALNVVDRIIILKSGYIDLDVSLKGMSKEEVTSYIKGNG